MNLRPLFRITASSLLLALALAGCKQETQAPAEPTAPAETAAADTATPAADATGTEAAAATPAAPATPAIDPADAPAPEGPAPVAGKQYTEIGNAQPFAPEAGKIEVAEVFGYTCPHCAQFEPLFEAWRARQPSDVKVSLVAAPFGGYWTPYARAFYAAETLGLVDKTHQPMFRAVHVERSLPVQPVPSDQEIGQFYAKYGANAQQFASTMSSFAVDAKVRRANQFIQSTGVTGTPTLVIGGKYRVEINEDVRSHEEVLRIADHLIARERAARASGG